MKDGNASSMFHGPPLATIVLFTAMIVLSCGGSTANAIAGSVAPGEDASIGASQDGGNASLGPGGANCSGSAAGCTCQQPGQTGACWTGPPSQRHSGACHDGTTQCIKTGEVSVWGPCQGQQLDCGTGSGDGGGLGEGGGGNEDAGGPGEGGGGNEPGTCACTPGAVIWCDADCQSNVYCSSSAQKSCLPDGTWGPCAETAQTNPHNGSCTHVGLGCQGCNNGLGYFTGDCSQQLRCGNVSEPVCPAGTTLSYSDQGVCTNGNCVGSGTCVWQ
jgi:hypothetical protein